MNYKYYWKFLGSAIFLLLLFVSRLYSQDWIETPWQVPVTISDGDDKSFVLTIGTAENASDGWDSTVDDLTAPPPFVGYYACLTISEFPDYLNTDIRSTTDHENSWDIILQDTTGDPTISTISWDNSGFPTGPVSGSLSLIDNATSNVLADMLAQNSIQVTGSHELRIDYVAPQNTSTVTQNIDIQPNKLNLISFNIVTDDMNIETMLDDIDLLIAKNDNGSFYIPSYMLNLIGDVNISVGYEVMINGSQVQTVVNEGSPVVPQNITKSFTNTKMYIICNPYQNSYAITDVFASITTEVVIVKDDLGKFWIPGFSLDLIGNMQPGKGYEIFVNENLDFTYPDMSSSLPKSSNFAAKRPSPTHFQFEETGRSHAIVITENDPVLSVGDEIAVFAGEMCVGASVFTGEYPLGIAAWEGIEKYDLAGFRKGQAISFKVWRSATNKEVNMDAEFADDNESQFGVTPYSAATLTAVKQASSLPVNFKLYQNYPNPFNPKTTIEYSIAQEGPVKLEVFDVTGRTINVLLDRTQNAGNYKIDFNAIDLPSGIYLYRLETVSFQETRRMILIK